MLNCIIGMVDKTRRAMSVLQERSVREREELALWARGRHPAHPAPVAHAPAGGPNDRKRLAQPYISFYSQTAVAVGFE